MKKLKLGLIALTALALFGCDTPATTSTPTEAKDYNVTFHYDFDAKGGYNADTKRPETYKKTEVLKSEKGAAVTVSRTLQRKFDCVDGYSFYGYSTETWKEGVTADMDVYVLYEALPTYTVTFKNVDGSVIDEISVPQGTELVEADFPSNVTYLIDSTAYGELDSTVKGLYEAYTPKSGWYILSEQKEGYIAIETGKVFNEFTGSLGDFTKDVTLTATDKVVDKKVKKMTSGSSIAVDGTKDSSYVHVSSLPYRFKSTDCTILLEYATLEEATAAGKAEDWEKAKKIYDEEEAKNVALETYLAWDGDWIYIFMEVTKPNVGTIGKQAMEAIGANPRSDGVELWYTLGKNFGDMNSRQFGTLAVDAFGTQCVHPGYQFAYEKHLTYTSKLIGNTTLNLETWDGKSVMTDATGYNVEIKMPAYVNSYDEVDDTFGAENWGEKVTNGMPMVFSTELKTIKTTLSEADLQTILETGSADSVRDNYGMQTFGGGWTTGTENTTKTDYRKFDTTVSFVA